VKHPLGEYFLTDIVTKLLQDQTVVVERTDFWHPVGYPKDIEAAEKILGRSHAAPHEWTNTKVVILAGGKGTRLPKEEQEKPKCMVEVAGKPILEHQLQLLHEQGFKNIHLALGYKSEVVIDWLKKRGYKNVNWVVEKEPLGTGGALKFATKGDHEPFLSFFGDILADFNFRGVIRSSNDGIYRVLAGVDFEDVAGMGVIECDEYKRICSFKEKQAEGVPGLINANASYLHPADFASMPDVFSIEQDLYPKLAREGKLVLYQHTGAYWFDCGTPERLARVREFFSKSR
jgi:NDP-sugar pyrophosphorylase family protein